MQLMEVQYTFEEFREAVAAHHAHLLAGKGKKMWIRRAIAGGILAMSAMVWILMASSSGLDVTKVRVVIGGLGPIIPWAALLSTTMGIQMVSARGIRAIRLFLLALLTATLIAASISYGLKPNEPPQNSDTITSLFAIYSWLFFLTVWCRIFFMYSGKRPYLKLWNGQQNLQTPKEIGIDENGVTINDVLVSTSYSWPAFARVREIQDHFLLYESDYHSHIIPKRSLVAAGGLEEFRALIEHHIHGRTRGFPVLQVQEAATGRPKDLLDLQQLQKSRGET